jgi:DNA-directed RNA polymerase subunit H (RpoH/RPB5)
LGTPVFLQQPLSIRRERRKHSVAKDQKIKLITSRLQSREWHCPWIDQEDPKAHLQLRLP